MFFGRSTLIGMVETEEGMMLSPKISRMTGWFKLSNGSGQKGAAADRQSVRQRRRSPVHSERIPRHYDWFGCSRRSSSPCQSPPSLSLLGYLDANWASLHLSMRYTSGKCFFINGCLVSLTSKKQRCVAVSTTESKYVAATLAACELIWL